jgi:glycosyltransferase involved in cell wall biosynthesis
MHVFILGSYAPSLINFRGPLIRDIRAAGHRISVGAPNIRADERIALEALGADVYETPVKRTGQNPLSDLTYLRNLRSLLHKVKPDRLVTYTIKPNIWGAFAATSLGVPSVALITGLGIAFTNTGKTNLKSRLTRLIARALYRRATALNWRVIFQNPDDRADFIAAGCLADASKIRMTNGSGVDLDHYLRTPLPDTPNFLMIARILGAKGVREYARAAIEVKHTHPTARFRLVGFFDEGPDAISTSEVDGWVAQGLEFLGPSNEVRPHLAACRVYVLPSYREGTPRSVLEAMATGRAILTSDSPGCRETVVDRVNGFLVPVRDTDTLADKMRWMIDNPDGCERMAAESLRIVREKYDVVKVNEVLMHHLGLNK